MNSLPSLVTLGLTLVPAGISKTTMTQQTNQEAIPAETQLAANASARQTLQDETMKLVREMPSDWRTMSEEAKEGFTDFCAFH